MEKGYAIAKTCLTLLGDDRLSVRDIRGVNTYGFNKTIFIFFSQIRPDKDYRGWI